jgi:hypothetical protein
VRFYAIFPFRTALLYLFDQKHWEFQLNSFSFSFFIFICVVCFQSVLFTFFIDETETHQWIASLPHSGYHWEILDSLIPLSCPRILRESHEFRFRFFIISISYILVISPFNLSIDTIETIISVPSVYNWVYDLYNFHFRWVYPVLWSEDIERGINSFSFLVSVWMTYLHICLWFILSFWSTDFRIPYSLLLFLTFYMFYKFAIGFFDRFDQ